MFHGKISSVVDYLCHNVNANHNVHKSRKRSGVAKKDIQPPLNSRLVACLESQKFML